MSKFILVKGLPEGGSTFIDVTRFEMDDIASDADIHNAIEELTGTFHDVLKGTQPNSMKIFSEKFGGNVFAIHKFCAFKVTFFDATQ